MFLDGRSSSSGVVDECIHLCPTVSGWICVFCPSAGWLIDFVLVCAGEGHSRFAFLAHTNRLSNERSRESEWGGIVIRGNAPRSVGGSEGGMIWSWQWNWLKPTSTCRPAHRAWIFIGLQTSQEDSLVDQVEICSLYLIPLAILGVCRKPCWIRLSRGNQFVQKYLQNELGNIVSRSPEPHWALAAVCPPRVEPSTALRDSPGRLETIDRRKSSGWSVQVWKANLTRKCLKLATAKTSLIVSSICKHYFSPGSTIW